MTELIPTNTMPDTLTSSCDDHDKPLVTAPEKIDAIDTLKNYINNVNDSGNQTTENKPDVLNPNPDQKSNLNPDQKSNSNPDQKSNSNPDQKSNSNPDQKSKLNPDQNQN